MDSVGVVMEALAERLRLDSDAMSPQERMQLLQMALQCCQHREQSWSALGRLPLPLKKRVVAPYKSCKTDRGLCPDVVGSYDIALAGANILESRPELRALLLSGLR